MKLFSSIMLSALLIVDVPIASAQIPQPIHFTVTVSDTQLTTMRRSQGLVNLSARTKRFRKDNGGDHSFLDLTLRRNMTYYAIPDGQGWMYLVPNDGFARIWSPGKIDLAGEPNTQLLVSFILPERLYPNGDTSDPFLTPRFDGTSASWGASGAEINYFDPRNPTSISLDSTGRASIVLGGIFEVGPTMDFQGYDGEASLTVSGDTLVRHIYFSVGVSNFLTSGIDSDLELDNLVRGMTYNATPDSAGSLTLTPNDGIAAVVSGGRFFFGAEPYAHLLVSFILPQRLYPTGGTGPGYISVSFDSTSAAWRGVGGEPHYFDPHEPLSMTLNASGQSAIDLGGIFQVDSGAAAGTYEGEALGTAQFVTSVGQPPYTAYPNSFQLDQNYPNPFNPITTIRYQIATSSHVQLRVFDVLGREIATLVNELKAPGEYFARWDATSYESGVYYCKFEAGSYSEVKKLVLIR